MEDSLLHGIFGVSKSYRSTGSEVKLKAVFVDLEPIEKLFCCPDCKSRNVIRRGKRTRSVQSLPIGFHPVFFNVAVPRCLCKDCGKRFEIAPPFAQPTPTTRRR